MPRSPGQAFVESAIAGTRIDRYTRVWRMGQGGIVGDSFVGRIGFERTTGLGELWDDSMQDFVVTQLKEGQTAPFAVNLRTFRIAFQRRPGVIERGAFCGALEDLLNEATSTAGWRVDPDTSFQSFDAWQSGVERVTRLHLQIDRPNPNYKGRERLEQIVEGTGAARLYLDVVASKDDPTGLDLTDEFVVQAIRHADLSYGDYVAEGEIDGRKSRYDSKQLGAPLETVIEADPDTREAPAGALRYEAGDT